MFPRRAPQPEILRKVDKILRTRFRRIRPKIGCSSVKTNYYALSGTVQLSRGPFYFYQVLLKVIQSTRRAHIDQKLTFNHFLPSLTCGQSYKHFMLVNYDSRVVPDWKIPHITNLEL